MDPTIKNWLRENRTEGVFNTHVSLFGPPGKYQCGRKEIEKLWDIYCNLLETEQDPIVGIAEKPQQYIPVLADIDLRIEAPFEEEEEEKNSLYTEDQLKCVVEVYQSVIRQIIEDCKDENLLCVVLEKKMYKQVKSEVTYFKHGFHLHFPYTFVDKIQQEIHLIPRVKEMLQKLKLFETLGITNSGDVIDKFCCKVPWLLYGSRKTQEAQPYRVTKIYNCKQEEITIEKAFKRYQIFDMEERLIPIRGKIGYYMPRILSIVPFSRPVQQIKHGLISPIKELIKKKERKTSMPQRRMTVEESLAVAKSLLPMISDYRVDDRNEWMAIGWALYNISEGSAEGLELWCDFSARSPTQYDENKCIFEWDRMVKKDITLGTLRHYAGIDNPGEYDRYKKEQAEKHIVNSLEGSHNDVAKALYAEYGDEFVCASIAGKIWYQFCSHKWEDIEEGVYLREKISGKIVDKYAEASKKLIDQLAKSQGKSEEGMIQSRIKQVNKMISNLKSSPYKTNVLKECMEVFYNSKFREKLDADPYLIAFRNGVYDLRLNVFRAGRPEDYLSKSMPIEYIVFTEHDEPVINMRKYLQMVFPDESIRKYFLDVSSDIFVGGNHEKIVLFWTGEGDNAKSITQKFFELMMGKLAIKLNTNVITGKKPSAGSAFADLARAGGGVRWAVLEEPDSDEAINIGIFKHLSGNDSLYARDLFERGKSSTEILPMFKLVFVCNKLPRMKYADKAVWNRVRVVPFEATFCREGDNVPETFEEQMKVKRFPMDKQFTKKIPDMVEAFAWILLEHRKKITVRIEPEKVRAATEIYRKQNDIYRQFIDESIVEDKNKYMSLAEIYGMFKDWFKDSLPNHTVPVKNEIEEYFVRLWGTPEAGKKWKGWRQKSLQDDIDDGTVVVLKESEMVKDEMSE